MSAAWVGGAIRGRGRPGSTAIPRWRMEDTSLDPHEFRVACWLSSHAGNYVADRVSRNEIANKTGVSAGKVSYALQHLAEMGIIDVIEGANRRLVIIFDFEVWERSPDDHQVVTTRPPSGHDVTTTREHHVEDHLENPPQPPQGGEVEPEEITLFHEFWSLYPRHEAKATAVRAWAKLTPEDWAACVGALPAWLAWKRRGRTATAFVRYCPHPTTFLNQRRWEDEIHVIVGPSKPSLEELAARERSKT